MSRVTICDRCKKVLECNPSAKIEIDFHYYGITKYEICERCKEKLIIFMRGDLK